MKSLVKALNDSLGSGEALTSNDRDAIVTLLGKMTSHVYCPYYTAGKMPVYLLYYALKDERETFTHLQHIRGLLEFLNLVLKATEKVGTQERDVARALRMRWDEVQDAIMALYMTGYIK